MVMDMVIAKYKEQEKTLDIPAVDASINGVKNLRDFHFLEESSVLVGQHVAFDYAKIPDVDASINGVKNLRAFHFLEENGLKLGFNIEVELEPFVEDWYTKDIQTQTDPEREILKKETSETKFPRKLYNCNLCGKIINWENYLKLHIRGSHSNERHPCHQCAKESKWVQALKQHIDCTHKGPIFSTKIKHKEVLKLHTKYLDIMDNQE